MYHAEHGLAPTIGLKSLTSDLARLAVNFKDAGNGGLFAVFEVPQMENGWNMENRVDLLHWRWFVRPLAEEMLAAARNIE